MAHYIIIYHGGEKPETPEQGAAQMEKWKAWLGALGEAVVNPGTPLGNSTMIDPAGDVSAPQGAAISGFSVVSADTQDAAIDMAKKCPFLEIGGSLEVAEMMQMP